MLAQLDIKKYDIRFALEITDLKYDQVRIVFQ